MLSNAYAIDHAHNVTFKSIGNANLVYSKNNQTDFVDNNYLNPKGSYHTKDVSKQDPNNSRMPEWVYIFRAELWKY